MNRKDPISLSAKNTGHGDQYKSHWGLLFNYFDLDVFDVAAHLALHRTTPEGQDEDKLRELSSLIAEVRCKNKPRDCVSEYSEIIRIRSGKRAVHLSYASRVGRHLGVDPALLINLPDFETDLYNDYSRMLFINRFGIDPLLYREILDQRDMELGEDTHG